jgi:hypothetical protein
VLHWQLTTMSLCPQAGEGPKSHTFGVHEPIPQTAVGASKYGAPPFSQSDFDVPLNQVPHHVAPLSPHESKTLNVGAGKLVSTVPSQSQSNEPFGAGVVAAGSPPWSLRG